MSTPAQEGRMQRYIVRVDIEVEAPTADVAEELIEAILDKQQDADRIIWFETVVTQEAPGR